MPSTAFRPLNHEPRSPDTGAYSVGVAVVHARPARTGWFAGIPARLFGGPGRMIGVDAARGLAVAGLVFGLLANTGAGADGAGEAGEAGAAVGVVTTALFMMVAGVSLTLALKGPPAGHEASAGFGDGLSEGRPDAALRVAVRSATLVAVGALVSAFGGSAAPQLPVLLQVLGALCLAALFVQRWRARTLFIAAGAGVIVLPTAELLLQFGWRAFEVRGLGDAPLQGGGAALVALFTATAYPALTWCAPFVAGLAVGRVSTARLWRQFTLLAAGGMVTAAAVAAAVLLDGATRAGSSLNNVLASHLIASADAVDAMAPTSGSTSTVDVLGACGVALTIVAVCLLLARRLRWLLMPLSALGSLALTASTALFAVVVTWPSVLTALAMLVRSLLTGLGRDAAVGDGPGSPEAVITLSVSVAGAVVVLALVAVLWRMLLSDGPVERGVSALSTCAERASYPRGGASDSLSSEAPQGIERDDAAGAAAPIRRSDAARATASIRPGDAAGEGLDYPPTAARQVTGIDDGSDERGQADGAWGDRGRSLRDQDRAWGDRGRARGDWGDASAARDAAWGDRDAARGDSDEEWKSSSEPRPGAEERWSGAEETWSGPKEKWSGAEETWSGPEEEWRGQSARRPAHRPAREPEGPTAGTARSDRGRSAARDEASGGREERPRRGWSEASDSAARSARYGGGPESALEGGGGAAHTPRARSGASSQTVRGPERQGADIDDRRPGRPSRFRRADPSADDQAAEGWSGAGRSDAGQSSAGRSYAGPSGAGRSTDGRRAAGTSADGTSADDPWSVGRSTATPRGSRATEPTPRGSRPTEPTPRGSRASESTPRGGRATEPTPRGSRATEPTPRGGRATEPTPRGSRATEPTPRDDRATAAAPRGGGGAENRRTGRLFGAGRARSRRPEPDDAELLKDEHETSAVVDSAEHPRVFSGPAAGSGSRGDATASGPPSTQWNPGQSLGRLPY